MSIELVTKYYAHINANEPQAAAQLLASDIALISPLAQPQGKEEVVPALQGFCEAVQQVEICEAIASGDKVFLIYNIYFPEPIGKLRAAGIIDVDVADGLINKIELIYDARPLVAKKDDIFRQ